jgi:hypothetical protein
MKKFAVTYAAIITVILLALTLTGCSSTFTSPLEPSTQKTTMEEAGNILGVPLPVPAYLPEGYEIQDTYINEREVTLLISDETIERKLVAEGEAMGTVSQRYEVKCKMRLVMRWYPEGGVPVRLPVEKVQINESWGFLQDRGNHNALWWDLFSEQGEEAMFEMVLAAGKGITKDELVKVAESISMPLIREYPDEVVRGVYEEIKRELFDERNLYDVIPQTGYSNRTIILGFAGEADTEIVDLVRSIIDKEITGVFLVVEENATRFQEPLLETPEISREQAIELATDMLKGPVAAVVARGDVTAQLHGWYWEVTFDNVDATHNELEPFPLMGPPPGGFGCSKSTDEEIYKSVVIAIDADTGDPVSAGANKEPRPGPYVSRTTAINSARERITTRLPEAWLERAKVEAYLRGDIWIVLFWEDGSKDNRIKASVDAVTGEAKGFSR